MSHFSEQKNVYGYIRVSTETQADKGYGLKTQEQAIKDYCKNNNLNLINVFADEGKSGVLGDKDNFSSRPALVELLDAIDCDTVVVMNTSRLWRDINARATISMKIMKSHGDILSIEQPTYSLYNKDPNDFLFNSMMELLDQWERMNINMRLSKGKTTKAKNGFKPSGKAPFGYQWNNKNIEVNSNESSIVKEMFSLASNNIGYQAIASKLNKQYKYNHSKKEWNRNDIYRILKNKFYIGILTHQGEEIQGRHEPIIEKNIWYAINSK